VYSNGVSEEIIGKAIKKYNLPRHKLVILTKCFAIVGEEPGLRDMGLKEEIGRSRDYVNQHGKSYPFYHHYDSIRLTPRRSLS
jgi:aryl-alcohol dehydrogenase-like predicted oxidoreductase